MNTITVKQINEIAAYDGPEALEGIRFRPARAALGVSAWGMNIIEFEPHCETYPEHNHDDDAQEEVYVILSGSLTLKLGQERIPLTVGALVRVPPNLKRKFVTGAEGATLLAIGGTPGKPYVGAG